MAIVTADIQYKPQQEIVRDVSVFLASDKDNRKLPKDFPKKEHLPAILYPEFLHLYTNDGRYSQWGAYGKLNGLLKKDLSVWTIINDPTGVFKSGTQIILYKDDDISVSNDYRYETVDGVVFLKYIHKHFFVFTNDYSQFIVVR